MNTDISDLIALNNARDRIKRMDSLDARRLADDLRTKITNNEIPSHRHAEMVQTLAMLDARYIDAAPAAERNHLEAENRFDPSREAERFEKLGDHVMAQRFEALARGETDQSQIEEPDDYVRTVPGDRDRW